MGQAVCAFSMRGELIYRYLLFLPEGHPEGCSARGCGAKGCGAESRGTEGRKWPLILFLHGIGERGDDPEVLKAYGPPKWASEHPEFPFVVASPQCPASSHWVEGGGEIEKLHALLDEITSACSVDPDRVYVTGLSMGGRGAWAMAIQRPERFAAIAPVCGRSDPEKAYLLKDLPVWVFHGAKDEVVPLEKAEEMVNALRACGGNVRFTVYPDAAHDAWTLTYGNPELYDWFLQHSKGKQGAGELRQAAR